MYSAKYKISVIIPIYNSETSLKRCLTSIINQTLRNIEILCINDGSTDNSEKIIMDISKKDERIKYFSLIKNSGSGPARNKGLEYAEGEYISFIDSDDFILDDTCYEKMYKFASKNGANLVSANLRLIDNNGELGKHPHCFEVKNDSSILSRSSTPTTPKNDNSSLLSRSTNVPSIKNETK